MVKPALRDLLRGRGATDAEIDQAERNGHLALLVLDREILPGERKYTLPQLAELSDIDLATVRLVWRTIGLPDLPDDARVFTDADLVALVRMINKPQSRLGESTVEEQLSRGRAMTLALVSLAETESEPIVSAVRDARVAGASDEDLAEELAAEYRFEETAPLLDHMHRLQLRGALWRKLVRNDPDAIGTITAAVGFADLVGYTSLSEDLPDEGIMELVERFVGVAYDIVVAAGGRIVKTIGDEVMFIARSPASAARIGVELTKNASHSGHLPPQRVGLAYGSMLLREGDYYGPVVNLASRLTEMAHPGSVLASAELAKEVEGDDRFAFRRLPDTDVRGIGQVDVYRVRSAVPDRNAPRSQ